MTPRGIIEAGGLHNDKRWVMRVATLRRQTPET